MAAQRARTDPTAKGRHRRCGEGVVAAHGPGGTLSPVSRWSVWRKETSPRQRPRSETRLERPRRVPSKELRPTPPCNARRCSRRRSRSRSPPQRRPGPLSGARAGARRRPIQSKALVASATLARGRVRLAEGDAADGERLFSEAARLWNEVGAPTRRRSHAGTRRSPPGQRQRAAAVLEPERRARCSNGIEAAQTTDKAAPLTDGTGMDERSAAELKVIRREGDYWSLELEGRTVRVRDLKGIRYLARLLAHPGREFHALDLVAAETGGVRAEQPEAGAHMRHSAMRARCSTHSEERVPPTPRRDRRGHRTGARPWRHRTGAQADAERDFLVRELSRAVGLRGRDRRAASASERARVAVTRAIRRDSTGQ